MNLLYLWLLAAAIDPFHGAPFPQDAAVSLKLPKEAAVGDHLGGEFVIRNTGQRNLSFALWAELHVQVKDGQGNLLPQLEGDLVRVSAFAPALTVLKAGETTSIEVPLDRYVDLTTPAAYVVSVWSALGWQMDDAHPSPVATARIELRSPTASYAAARVRALCEKKTTEEEANSAGHVLEHLRDPQYLPALRAAAQAGHPEACFGIASIVGEAASETLLTLAHSADDRVAKAATMALLQRLPAADEVQRLRLTPFGYGDSKVIRQSWPAKLDGPLLELALKILSRPPKTKEPVLPRDLLLDGYFRFSDVSIVSPAATMVAARGGPPNADTVLAATQRALEIRIEPRTGFQGVDDQLPEPLPALIDAIDALRQRGWSINQTRALSDTEALRGEAGLLAFFRQLADPQSSQTTGRRMAGGDARLYPSRLGGHTGRTPCARFRSQWLPSGMKRSRPPWRTRTGESSWPRAKRRGPPVARISFDRWPR
ncbi:MAG: hypothetical protein WDN28_19925 [Chthoniobacter sp.]